MKKRIIAMILSIVMVIGMLPASVFAVEADNLRNFTKRNTYTNYTFDDVQKDDWFYENVKSVYELGLMQGKGENKFDTESGITIAETLTIAARLHSIYFTGSDAFEASNPWYQVYADYCAVNGIASVNSETYSQTATRAEFVTVLANSLPGEVFGEINKVAANAIPDVNINDTYGAAVYKMYRAGIMIGNDDVGTFAPTSEIRRSEVATIVTRMVDVSLRKSIQLGNEYTVTFNMNGHGKQIDPQSVVEGYTAEKPADPTKATYVFKGWYTQKTGGQQFDFNMPITEDITLYARWEIDPLWLALMMGWMNNQNNSGDRTYTVTFDANGNGVTNLPASQTVRYGEYAVVPHEPTRIGYVFAGWYLDKSGILVWDESTPIYNDTTIYASWYYAGINQDDSEAKYKISDIIVDENEPIINIEVTTQDECYLRLVITNDAQTEIIYDENVSVHSDLWYEKISINVANLPEYFYIHAFLVDSNGNELCDNYTSVLYSRYFAEFYEKDVDDFDANLVLNFDNNGETNFSVAQNDVVIYELLSSQVVKNEKKITITGANIPTFVVGQKYVIFDGESIYLCKPTSVDQNGTETTILTDELPLTDYLSYIKIEEVSYAYDTSSSSEQISTFARIDIIDIPGGDNKQTISAGFTVGNDEDDAEIELKADGYIKNTFRLYLAADVSWQGIKPIFYLKEEVEVDLSVNLSARGTVLSSASGEKSKIKTTEELAEINIPIGGIVQPILKLYVPIEANLNAKFDIGFGIKATYGVEYSFENGGRIIDDLDKSFDDQSKVEGEFDLRVGFKASIGVEVLKIVEIKLGGEAGFKTIISIDAESHLGENVVSKHMCAFCLEGVLDFYVKASIDVDVDIEIFGVDLITGNLIHYAPLEYTFTLGSCYFSLINSSNSVHKGDVTFGWGTCPNIAWKTTFIVKNSSDTTTNDLVNIHNNRSDDVSLVFSGNSVFSEFLYNGSYIAKSTIDGTEYTQTFRVDDASQTVTIKATNGGSSIDPEQPGDDDPIVPVPPVQDGYTLRLKFVDEMDERVLPLTELFAPDITDTALGNKYNGSHIRLTNGENEAFDVGDFLNKANDDLSDGMYILGDEIIFTGLEASEEYYVWFDAWSDQYVLPNYEYRFRVPELVENGGQLIPSDETEVVGTIRLTKEYLTVGDTVVTSTNAADIFGDGTANYSFATNTLTLINAKIDAQKPIYYYGNKKLNVVIPSGTTSNLSCSQVLGTVVYSYNSISISGGGSLYLHSSATFSGFMSNNEYCIFGYYGVEVSGISLTLGNANYGVASEKADVRLENCMIDIGIPGPNVMFYTRKNGQSIIIRNCDVKNYNFNLYSVISVSSSNVSLYDSTILAYGESNIMSAKKLIIQGGKITLKAYEESIGEDGTIAFELISALESITLMNGITIIKPENGLVVNSTDGHYSIRCADGAYPTEIVID